MPWEYCHPSPFTFPGYNPAYISVENPQKRTIMNAIIGKLNDGGPAITYTIILLLLVILALFIKVLVEKDYTKKSRAVIASVGWFALAWGYLGRTIGLIMAFDKIAAMGEITPEATAGGLKMALVGPLCGLVTFLVARAVILYLQIMSKKETFG